jgi:hypothetical protein
MRPDFLGTYSPPGIYTNPIQGPQLAINSSLPTAVGLVGTAVGFKTYTDSFTFRDTDEADPIAVTLSQKGIIKSSIVVRSRDTLLPKINYPNTTDYTVTDVVGAGIGAPGSSTSRCAIRRNTDAGGHIAADETVVVSYNYTDSAYYIPQEFYDYRDVVSTYGNPFDTTDKTNVVITSELSLAAKFAFLNGAYKIVCAPVEPTGAVVGGFTQATTPDYNRALDLLKDSSSVAIVVPLNGISSAEQVRAHVNQQSNSRFERRAILGFDGRNTVTDSTTRRGLAKNESYGRDARIMMVSPSQFYSYASELDKVIALGGQYMAASLAGMTVALSFAQPLTHKYPVGWRSLSDFDSLREGEMTTETTEGLCVIEYDRRKSIRVRHGVSTLPDDLLSREWSITGQQDALVYRLRDYLDDANLIGQPIYNYTLVNVKASAEAGLQSLVRDGLLVDYVGLSVRQLLTNPDVIEISFGWRPAFPLNYIVLTFAVNLTTGSLNSNSTTSNRSNVTSTTQTTVTSLTASATNDFGGSGNTLNSA